MHKICEHGRRHAVCKDCGGSQICEHKRTRSVCVECGGGMMCEHRRERRGCKECGGYRVWAMLIETAAKRRAKKAGLLYELDRAWIIERLKKGCPVFNRPFDCSSRVPANWSATLDNFKPELGYTKENSHIISLLANLIKTSTTSSEQVFKVAEWMKSIEDKL